MLATRDGSETDNSTSLESSKNIGPLSMVAVALFGEKSFLGTNVNNLNNATFNSSGSSSYNEAPANNRTDPSHLCLGSIPLIGLGRQLTLNGELWQTFDSASYLSNCVLQQSASDTHRDIANWLSLFWDPGTDIQTPDSANVSYHHSGYAMQPVFKAALYLSHLRWLSQPVAIPTLTINYDMGVDFDMPNISRTGAITISCLLAIFISSLIAMAIYASYVPTWTSSLDAFALMRIGAAIGEPLQLQLTNDTRSMRVLDTRSGYVGDAAPDSSVGVLSLGARARLRRKRKYRGFKDQLST